MELDILRNPDTEGKAMIATNLHEKDKVDAKTGSETMVNENGAARNHSNVFHGSQGEFPNTLGEFHSTQGEFPKTQGDFPKTQGDFPNTQGEFPTTQEEFSKTQGEFPKTLGKFNEPQEEFHGTQGEYHGTKVGNGVYTKENLENRAQEEDHELIMNEFGSMSFIDEDDYYMKEEIESTVPTDRGWAWMTVVGCFGMHILAVGGVKSFGVLFVELEHHYDTTTKALASVQAVATTIMMGMSPISNVLSMKFGCRRVVFVGGLLMGSGFVTSAFVSSYQWLYFTYGVIGGLGFGLSYAPCIVFVGQHFNKYRALANGLSVSGSGVGTFLFPLLINLFTREYGLSGAMLLVGGIMLNVCVCATLFRPLSSYKDRKVRKRVFKGKKSGSTIENKESNDAQEKLLELDDRNSEKKVAPNPRVVVLQSEMSFSGSTGNIAMATMDDGQFMDKNRTDQIEKQSKKKSKSCLDLFDWSLLKNPVFLVFLSSVTISNFAYPNVFVMIPSYGEEIGLDQTTGALFVSVIGISDLVGRVFFGWFSDRRLLPRKYEFMGTMGISGVLSLILPFVKSYGFVIAYCATYGFFAGAYVALIAVVLVDTLGIHKLSSAFGFVGFGMMLGLLSGPPIIGALRDASSSWDNSFIFCAILALLGTSIILLEPLAQKAEMRKNRKARAPVIV